MTIRSSAGPPVGTLAHRLKTSEPVFGIIKSVPGFRQFSMRGLDRVRGD